MTERFEITTDKIMQELAKLGFSNIGNYLAKDADGRTTPAIDLTQCTPDQLAALEAVQYEEEARLVGVGQDDSNSDEHPLKVVTRKVKIKLHDKKGALVDMLKQLGGQYEAPDKDKGDDGKLIRVEGGLPLPPAYKADVPTGPAPAPVPVAPGTIVVEGGLPVPGAAGSASTASPPPVNSTNSDPATPPDSVDGAKQ